MCVCVGAWVGDGSLAYISRFIVAGMMVAEATPASGAGPDPADLLDDKFHNELDQVCAKLCVLMASTETGFINVLQGFALRIFLPVVVMLQNVFEPEHLTTIVCKFMEAIPHAGKDAKSSSALYDSCCI